jgi:hypothetical protein
VPGGRRGRNRPVAEDEGARVVPVGALPEQKHQFPPFTRLQRAVDLQSGAGIEPRAGSSGENALRHRGRPREVPVPAEERSAIGGERHRRFAHVRKRGVAAILLVVGVARQNGAGRRVDVGHDMEVNPVVRRPEHPLREPEHTESAGGRSTVRQCQHRELDRVDGVDEHLQFVVDAVNGSREMREAGGMVHDAPVVLTTGDRFGCGRPIRAGLLITYEDHLARRIAHGIVGERRQPVLPAVAAPRVRRSRRADDGAKVRVRDDVDPRHRGLLAAVEHNGVAAPLIRKPAEAVSQRHLGERRRSRASPFPRCRAGGERLTGRRLVAAASQLRAQVAVVAVEHRC